MNLWPPFQNSIKNSFFFLMQNRADRELHSSAGLTIKQQAFEGDLLQSW